MMRIMLTTGCIPVACSTLPAAFRRELRLPARDTRDKGAQEGMPPGELGVTAGQVCTLDREPDVSRLALAIHTFPWDAPTS